MKIKNNKASGVCMISQESVLPAWSCPEPLEMTPSERAPGRCESGAMEVGRISQPGGSPPWTCQDASKTTPPNREPGRRESTALKACKIGRPGVSPPWMCQETSETPPSSVPVATEKAVSDTCYSRQGPLVPLSRRRPAQWRAKTGRTRRSEEHTSELQSP